MEKPTRLSRSILIATLVIPACALFSASSYGQVAIAPTSLAAAQAAAASALDGAERHAQVCGEIPTEFAVWTLILPYGNEPGIQKNNPNWSQIDKALTGKNAYWNGVLKALLQEYQTRQADSGSRDVFDAPSLETAGSEIQAQLTLSRQIQAARMILEDITDDVQISGSIKDGMQAEKNREILKRKTALFQRLKNMNE